MEDISKVIEKLGEIIPRTKEINSFMKVERLRYTIVIDDTVASCAYAEAFPIFRLVRLPISLFLGLYPPIYHGLGFKIDFTVLHEHAHLITRYIIAKDCGIFAAYTIPKYLDEYFCDGISVMFSGAEKAISLILRCLYVMNKMLAYSEHLEKIIQRLRRAISMAVLLENRQELFYLEFLEVQKNIQFFIRIVMSFKTDWKSCNFTEGSENAEGKQST